MIASGLCLLGRVYRFNASGLWRRTLHDGGAALSRLHSNLIFYLSRFGVLVLAYDIRDVLALSFHFDCIAIARGTDIYVQG